MSEDSELSKNNQDPVIIIRRAKPDVEEGLVIAELFDQASEGFFKSVLGTRMHEIIAEAYVKSNNEYSYENISILDYNNSVVGMVSGYTPAEKEGFKKNILSQFSKGAKLRIIAFAVIGRILFRFMGSFEEEDYYLQAIAVKSQMRGKGLGQKLLKHSSEIATKKGAKTLSLDVSSKNKRAIKSYKKFGMEIISSWPNFLKIPSIFTRMTKEL